MILLWSLMSCHLHFLFMTFSSFASREFSFQSYLLKCINTLLIHLKGKFIFLPDNFAPPSSRSIWHDLLASWRLRQKCRRIVKVDNAWLPTFAETWQYHVLYSLRHLCWSPVCFFVCDSCHTFLVLDSSSLPPGHNAIFLSTGHNIFPAQTVIIVYRIEIPADPAQGIISHNVSFFHFSDKFYSIDISVTRWFCSMLIIRILEYFNFSTLESQNIFEKRLLFF